MSSNMGQRMSIGLANLMDAAPLSSPPHHARRSRTRKRKPKQLSVELVASKGDGAVLSAASPTALVVEVSSASAAPLEQGNETDQAHAEDHEDGKHAETAQQLLLVEPTTPRGSAVSAVALFDAIANDAFFETMARLGVELCASEDDTQRVRANARRDTAIRAVVNVNGFKDPTHGKTLLHQACKTANFHVIKCLLYNGASTSPQCVMGRTPFHDVISSGQRDQALQVLQALYDYEPQGISRVDINGTHVVHLAAIHGCLDVIQWCGRLAQQSESPLSMSITSFSGRNMLHYAAYNGRLPVLEWLLQDGAVRGPSIASLDVNGYSALHYAAMGGHLEVCRWLVYDAPSRRDLNIVGTNSDGHTALDLARQTEIQAFLEQVSQVPDAPTNITCIGVDTCSMGISWTFEPSTENQRLREELTPKWFELEYCKKPVGLRRASALLSILMIVPSETAGAAALSASSYLLDWEALDVFIQPDSREYWLAGLESDCEYLVRMRTFNRNGYSEYSVPSLSGEFKTTASNASEIETIKRNSFFDLLTPQPSRIISDLAFIGTLELELLEARRLLHCSSLQSSTRREAADQGRFFGVLTLQLPLDSNEEAPRRRRTSLSLFKFDRDPERSHAPQPSPATRCLYRLRTDFATLQQDLLQSGSLQAFRHPQFGVRTPLRVPEALDSELIIEVHHETPSANSSVVGMVRLPLKELVRGFPAKLQWLTLEHGSTGDPAGGCEQTHGEVLIRSLFLADGIRSLPHPTRLGMDCSSAEELLDDTADLSFSSPPLSSTSTITVSSSASNSPASSTSSSPRLSPMTFPPIPAKTDRIKYDPLGFRVYPSQEIFTYRNYEYYRQHHIRVASQQEQLWLRYHLNKLKDEEETPQRMISSTSFSAYLRGSDHDGKQYEPSDSRDSAEFRRLVWNGIPPSSRRVLYMTMSGSSRKRRAAGKGYYQRQLQRAMELKVQADEASSSTVERHERTKFDIVRRQIQVDLQRTFAGNQSWINSADGQAAMERVLLTYAVHNERIGYCQSMSFIAGRLLCLFHDLDHSSESCGTDRVEEDVFWLLGTLCEDYFPSNYSKGMEGLHVDGLVLEALLQRRLPKIARHFLVVLHNPQQMGLLLVTGWLLPIFCAVFPSETSFRLLDVLIYEGSGAVFSLVIALLRMVQPQILCDTKDYMQLFRLLKERDQRLHDTALLMEIALDEHLLLENDISALRKQCEVQHDEDRCSQDMEQELRRSERLSSA